MPDRTQLREDEPTPGEKVGIRVPHPARMYDYYLGGKDNFEADRIAAEKAMSVVPDAQKIARTNREFLVRVVQTMADSGVDQFIDLGTGFPTSPNVHEVARERRPNARIVYVDNDPVVVAHNRALRQGPGVLAIDGDIRDPQTILSNSALTEMIDFTRPVGVLFIAVLHFVPDEFRPSEIVTNFRLRMPSGSMLAISHTTGDDVPEAVMRTIQDAYTTATAPALFRSRAEVEALFGGVPLLPPGVVEVSKWRPHDLTTRVKSTLRILGGVARVP
jgi:hypothetical protein